MDESVHFPYLFGFLDTLAKHSVIYVALRVSIVQGELKMEPKMMCLMVLSCGEISETSKKELEEVVVVLKKLKNWEIEKITLMEDQKSTK